MIHPVESIQLPLFESSMDDLVERFELSNCRKWIIRSVDCGRTERRSKVRFLKNHFYPDDLPSSFDAAWLRTRTLPDEEPRGRVKIVDLFAGCGGLSLGVSEACRALQLKAEHLIAFDTNQKALDAYSAEDFRDVQEALIGILFVVYKLVR